MPELARTLKAQNGAGGRRREVRGGGPPARPPAHDRGLPGPARDDLHGPRGPGRRRPGPRGGPRGRLRLLHAQGQDPEFGGARSSTRRPASPTPRSWADFLAGFYTDRELPPRLLLPAPPAQTTGLQALLGWAKVRVIVPRGGKNRKLVDLAGRNAEAFLRQAGARRRAPRGAEGRPRPPAPSRVASRASTSPTPAARNRSAPSSSSATAGPTRTRYRKFLIRTVEGSNDVASLAEVITRRYRKVLEEGDAPPRPGHGRRRQAPARRGGEGAGRARPRPASRSSPSPKKRRSCSRRLRATASASTGPPPPSSSSRPSATRPTASPSPSTAAAARRGASPRSSTASRDSARKEKRLSSAATPASRPSGVRRGRSSMRWWERRLPLRSSSNSRQDREKPENLGDSVARSSVQLKRSLYLISFG